MIAKVDALSSKHIARTNLGDKMLIDILKLHVSIVAEVIDN
jgi:hypothetical protein